MQGEIQVGYNDEGSVDRAKHFPGKACYGTMKPKERRGEGEKVDLDSPPPSRKKQSNRDFVNFYLGRSVPLEFSGMGACDSNSRGNQLQSTTSAAPCSSSIRHVENAYQPVAIDSVIEALGDCQPKWNRNPSSMKMTDVDDDDSCKFSVTEMKSLVMERLPPSILNQVPAKAWDRIFSENDSVLSDQSPLVKRLRGGSKSDVSDIVCVISSIVSHRVSEGNFSVASEVSGLTDPFRGRFGKKAVQSVRAPEPPAARTSTVRVPAMISLSSCSSEHTVNNTNDKRNTGAQNRCVRFAQVKIREFEVVLTLNPAVTSGPSIGLGWDHAPNDEEYSVDEFEISRVRSRRDSKHLILPRNVREEMLLSLGYSHREIADAIRKTVRVKKQRTQTVQNLHVSAMEEFLETATRRMKRVLRFPAGRKSGRQQQLVATATNKFETRRCAAVSV